MRAPKWIRRWLASRARYERRLADADRRAAAAVNTAEALRAQLSTVKQRCEDARSQAQAAQEAAIELGRGIGHIRLVLAEFDGTRSPTTVALAASIRRALDGEEVPTR